MNKDTQSIPLLDFCEESTTITCDSCRQSENLLMDSMVAIDEFYTLGWRVKKEKCLCPSCASKDATKIVTGSFSKRCSTARGLRSFEKNLKK